MMVRCASKKFYLSRKAKSIVSALDLYKLMIMKIVEEIPVIRISENFGKTILASDELNVVMNFFFPLMVKVFANKTKGKKVMSVNEF